MKTTLSATVPTTYQFGSINAFGIEVKSNGNGSYSCSRDFETKTEAVKYLLDRAEFLAEDEKELKNMKKEIRKFGVLSYDAACLGLFKTEKTVE